jgi:hypothetical protein
MDTDGTDVAAVCLVNQTIMQTVVINMAKVFVYYLSVFLSLIVWGWLSARRTSYYIAEWPCTSVLSICLGHHCTWFNDSYNFCIEQPTRVHQATNMHKHARYVVFNGYFQSSVMFLCILFQKKNNLSPSKKLILFTILLTRIYLWLGNINSEIQTRFDFLAIFHSQIENFNTSFLLYLFICLVYYLSTIHVVKYIVK